MFEKMRWHIKLSGKCELMHEHHFAHFRLAKYRRLANSFFFFFVRMKVNENYPTVLIAMSIGEIFLEGNLAFFSTL